MALRIKGLVQAADRARRKLAEPLSAAERDLLRAQVTANLQQVENILRQSRAKLNDLPAPTQRAYHFLANIDWAKTIANSPAAARPASVISLRGMGPMLERVWDRLALDLSDPDLQAVGNTIARASREIEGTIQRQSLAVERFTPTSRSQRGWLAFFARPENLAAYVQARKTASRLLNEAAADSRHYPPPWTIHFRPVRGIYKLKPTRHGPVLWLPTPMITFDESAFAALAARMFERKGTLRQAVVELMTGGAYQAVRAELEALGGIVEQTRGAVHDLSPSFDRVNATYFGGKMERPRLTWNRTFTGRKFGHYDWIHDTVMVSRTLDSPTVPEFVVDFLVFHELLHKFHGLHWVNGRGYAHTAEFNESERKFRRYVEAEAVLEKLARSV